MKIEDVKEGKSVVLSTGKRLVLSTGEWVELVWEILSSRATPKNILYLTKIEKDAINVVTDELAEVLANFDAENFSEVKDNTKRRIERAQLLLTGLLGG